jgi:hypothetical protein
MEIEMAVQVFINFKILNSVKIHPAGLNSYIQMEKIIVTDIPREYLNS